MKVTVQKFIEGVNSIYVEKPSYELGHDGSDGKCDCIGMVRGGLDRAGAKDVRNMRGTNQASRKAIEELHQVSSSAGLKVGDVVLKVRDKDDASMPLPDRYRKGGSDYDHRLGETNFTHIGTVTRTGPLEITHMTSPTAQKDTKLGRWSWAGKLPWVDYDGGGGGMQPGRVVAPTGSTVNLRKEPSASAALIDRIPVGSECEIIEEQGEWDKIVTCGLVGWMMSRFIEKTGGDVTPEPDDDVIGDTVTITLTSAEAAAACPVLAKICEQIAGTIGRG